MAGHVIELDDKVFDLMKEHCMEVYRAGKSMSVDELLIQMMDYPQIPMHYPYHHFIMPAALLTLASMEKDVPADVLEEMLNVAKDRAKNVLGGFCGNYGACGAGVGVGIFMSVFTGTSPLSEETWQWTNEVTGIALQKISSIPGPRCCKRTAFLAITETIPYINDKLQTKLYRSDNIVCKYSAKNQQCKFDVCPFYNSTNE